MKKLKGVTLVETVVVLILTTLVAGFCVYAYLIVKQNEQLLYRNTNRSTELGLAAYKMADMAYQCNTVKWFYPKLTFESNKYSGSLKFNVDSIDILNENDELLCRIPLSGYSIDTIDMGQKGLYARAVSIQTPVLKYSFNYKQDYPCDFWVNNSIDWKN